MKPQGSDTFKEKNEFNASDLTNSWDLMLIMKNTQTHEVCKLRNWSSFARHRSRCK
jgi:hypothetical protein